MLPLPKLLVRQGGVRIMIVIVALDESRSSVSLALLATSLLGTLVSPTRVPLSPSPNGTSAADMITRMIGRNSLLANTLS